MPYSFYLGANTSDLGGGADFNRYLEETGGTGTSISVSTVKATTETSYAFTRAGIPSNDNWQAGVITIKLKIISTGTSMSLYAKANRISDTGTVLQTSSVSPTVAISTAGATVTLTIPSTTWTTGSVTDRLRIDFSFVNASTGARTVVIDGNIASTCVYAGQTGYNPEFIKVNDNTAVIAYKASANGYGTLVVADLLGNGTISYGTGQVFRSTSEGIAQSYKLAVIDSNHFLLTYLISGLWKAKVCTITGTVISFGTEITIPNITKLLRLTSTTFIIQGATKCYVLTVSGTSVSVSTNYNYTTGAEVDYGMARINDTTFIITVSSNSNITRGRIATVSGSIISFNPEYIFNSGSASYYPTPSMLSESVGIVAYRDNINGMKGTCQVLTINGTEISFGSEQIFCNSTTNEIVVVPLSSNKLAISYCVDTTAYVIVGTVNGTTVSFGTAFTLDTNTTHAPIALLNSSHLSAMNYNNAFIILKINDTFVSNLDTTILTPLSAKVTNVVPIITLQSNSLFKISHQIGKTSSVVVFRSDVDLLAWEARAGGTSNGLGVLVGSGGSATANTDITFSVDDIELLSGDGVYRINVYGQNAIGWTPYG